MNAPRAGDEAYIQFLLATPEVASAAEAGRVQPAGPKAPAHDAFTRLLSRLEPDPDALWDEVRPLVTRAGGTLVIDDTVLDKPFARKMGLVGYSASKAAVLTYCEAFRIELAPRGVAVTCVCLGFVATPMTAPNQHLMPWLLTADAAAARIIVALRRKPAVASFPKRMRLLMALTKWLPDAVIRRRVPVPPPDRACQETA